MVRRYRANGVDYLAHADQHAAGGLDPVAGGGGGGGGYATVQDEGVGLTVRTILNFKGTGVTAADNAGTGATDVTIPGGGGTPAASVVAETGYGQATVVGVATNYAREDHSHGSPALGATGTTAAAGNHSHTANPALATNAIVLGAAAAAGVATTTLRSDDTIAAFDATVPVTQAFGDAAAVGAAARAARRDHVHGMPLDGLELLGSTVLGANAATTATVVLSAIRNEIWIVYRVVGYTAGDIATFRFGNATIDTGNNYYTRYITVAAGGVSLTNVATNSTNGLRVAGNSQTTGRSGLIIISNLAASEKIASVMDFCGSGAVATSPAMNLCGGGAWVNTTQQFDRLLMLAIGGQSLLAGSGFTVYGKNM